MSRSLKWMLRLVLIVAVVLVIGAAGFVIWGSTPLGPTDAALQALHSDGTVSVTMGGNGGGQWISFRPTALAPSVGLIFYPGGRVDPRSYAPLARAIASEGNLVVVVQMPLSLAVFAPMRATAVMAANPEVDVWAIGGHSLGGAMAARYVYADAGAADGLVLWAAYPAATDDLSQRSDLAALSVYGTRDGLMTAVEREASRSLMPQNTCWVAIEGGNHAQFGDYGVQARDNAPTISMAHQHAEVVAATSSFLMMLDGMAVGESFNCSSLGGVQ